MIIATGASAKYLGLPTEEKFRGLGVSACATCDGFFYRGKDVAVVGGGDTACEEATYLAGLCRKVYLIVRKNYLRASKAMQQRVFNTENIEVLFEHNTLELYGSDMGLEGARLLYRKGEPEECEKDIKIDGFFLAIGHHPNSEVFSKYVKVDEQGYIITEGASTVPMCRVCRCRRYHGSGLSSGDCRCRFWLPLLLSMPNGISVSWKVNKNKTAVVRRLFYFIRNHCRSVSILFERSILMMVAFVFCLEFP